MSQDYDIKRIMSISQDLIDWFQSKEVTPVDAHYVMMNMLGAFTGRSSNNKAHLEEGLAIIAEGIRNKAEVVFERRDQYD
jgi:hypothetical protein